MKTEEIINQIERIMPHLNIVDDRTLIRLLRRCEKRLSEYASQRDQWISVEDRLYREVKCSDRLPKPKKNKSVISQTYPAEWETFTEGAVLVDSYYDFTLKGWRTPFIAFNNLKHEPTWWLEEYTPSEPTDKPQKA